MTYPFKDEIDQWIWQNRHMKEYTMNCNPVDKEIVYVIDLLYKRLEKVEEELKKYEIKHKG